MGTPGATQQGGGIPGKVCPHKTHLHSTQGKKRRTGKKNKKKQRSKSSVDQKKGKLMAIQMVME